MILIITYKKNKKTQNKNKKERKAIFFLSFFFLENKIIDYHLSKTGLFTITIILVIDRLILLFINTSSIRYWH